MNGSKLEKDNLLHYFRGVVNQELTAELMLRLGAVIGSRYGRGGFLVAGDMRNSTPMLMAALQAGLISSGARAIDCGRVPTPVLAYACKREELYGAMVTASHNPPRYNGLKVFQKDSRILAQDVVQEILNLAVAGSFRRANWRHLGETVLGEIACEYSDSLRTRRVNLRGLRFSYDALDFGPEFLEGLYPKLGVTALNVWKDPGRSHILRQFDPERDPLRELRRQVVKEQARFGARYDGDLDKVIFVDEQGRRISGQHILLMLAKHMAAVEGSKAIVVTVEASDSIIEYLRGEGFSVSVSPVGQERLVKVMQSGRPILGAEPNGHYIFPLESLSADGIRATLYFAEYLKMDGRPVSQILKSLPSVYAKKFLLFPKSPRVAPSVLVRSVQRISSWLGPRMRADIEAFGGDTKIITNKDCRLLIRPSHWERCIVIQGDCKEKAGLRIIEKLVYQVAQFTHLRLIRS